MGSNTSRVLEYIRKNGKTVHVVSRPVNEEEMNIDNGDLIHCVEGKNDGESHLLIDENLNDAIAHKIGCDSAVVNHYASEKNYGIMGDEYLVTPDKDIQPLVESGKVYLLKSVPSREEVKHSIKVLKRRVKAKKQKKD